MISNDQFQELQLKYFEFGELNPPSEKYRKQAKMILFGISEIEEVHQELRQKYDDERHWYQQQFITRSVNSILSTYLLSQNYFHSSAYRDIRNLYETFLLLNHMNENKIKTARILLKQDRDLKAMNVEEKKLSWERLYVEDEFHKMKSAEKSKLENRHSEFSRLYDYFSNTHIHPTRIDGVDLTRTYVQEEERQIFDWLLDFILGLGIQLLKLYSDTDDYLYVMNQLKPVITEIDENHSTQPFIDVVIDEFSPWS